MANLDERALLFLQSLPFFNKLEKEDATILVESANVKEYPKGQTILLVGDRADKFFIIMSGWVKLFRATAEGEEAILAVFTRGDVFGEAAIFENASYPFSAQVAEDAKLMEVPSFALRDRAKSNPDIMNRMMSSMSREMHKLQLENEHLAIMTAPQRVGCLLLQLSSGMIGKGGTFSFPYGKSLAAARLGMKPETFSRALAQLKPFGVTTKGSEITIQSFNCLIQYVCGNCSAQQGECRGSRDTDRGCARSCGDC
jgi:CRP-like cAMP-binding protein